VQTSPKKREFIIIVRVSFSFLLFLFDVVHHWLKRNSEVPPEWVVVCFSIVPSIVTFFTHAKIPHKSGNLFLTQQYRLFSKYSAILQIGMC
jgi:hypothetical protein